MRVIFMGSPEFSVPVLDALVSAGHDIACVYCQPPRPAGRGKKLRPTAVHARAEALGLSVRHPTSLKTDAALADFSALNADIAVVVAYGMLLPQAVLDCPKHGCLNIHASLLPRWRGAAPIHRAILEGDTETGVCIMQMEAGLDTGPVLMRQSTKISALDTTATLHDRLSDIGAALIVQALDRLDQLSPEPQPEAGITYAAKIEKTEAEIDWNGAAVEIDRQIRGLSPFPGAWTLYKGERIKFLFSEVVDLQGTPGVVLDRDLTIGCGQHAVRVTRMQRAGKGAMSTQDILRGWDIAVGDKLGD